LKQKKTKWFFLGDGGAVVEDLNPKACEMRLLWVPKEHVPCGQETRKMREEAMRMLLSIARAVCANGGWKVAGMDFDKHKFRAHWHAQACLVKR